MATETKTMTREQAWKAFDRAVKTEFPGRGNAGLRAKIRQTALAGLPVGNLGSRIALTACGAVSLDECDTHAVAWQEIARREDPTVFDETD